MNEKGEATLFAVLILVSLTGIMVLCSLELTRSYRLLTRRSSLFLCTRELKGELNNYLRTMGRSNWAIKNIQKAKLVMIFIPGLQGAALNAEKAKAFLRLYQDTQLLIYLARLKNISAKGCSPDPGMFLSPYELQGPVHARDQQEAAIKRKDKWTYHYIHLPYSLSVDIDATQSEKVQPKVFYSAGESMGKSSFPSSIAW